jgi:hypothetical protein
LCLNKGFEIFEVLKDFFPRKKIHVKCDKSSKKMITYLDLLIDGCGKGPMMSLWIGSKGEESL